MHTDTNFFAPAALFGFLLACSGLLLTLIVAIVARVARKPCVVRSMLGIAGCALIVYLAMLIGFSLASRRIVLAPGQEKYFCELDCHLAYSVVGVRKARAVGSGQDQVHAHGTFYIVTLRTRFDEKTIAPFRSKDVPLSPGLRSLSIVDDGAVYDISPQGQQALPPSPSLLTPLRPAESYMTEFVFDLPDRVRNPQLLITTAYRWPNRLLVGDEQSFLHQQTLLSLASD